MEICLSCTRKTGKSLSNCNLVGLSCVVRDDANYITRTPPNDPGQESVESVFGGGCLIRYIQGFVNADM